jgi:hypothetical protein
MNNKGSSLTPTQALEKLEAFYGAIRQRVAQCH